MGTTYLPLGRGQWLVPSSFARCSDPSGASRHHFTGWQELTRLPNTGTSLSEPSDEHLGAVGSHRLLIQHSTGFLGDSSRGHSSATSSLSFRN